jgi:hypothetical protein
MTRKRNLAIVLGIYDSTPNDGPNDTGVCVCGCVCVCVCVGVCVCVCVCVRARASMLAMAR